MSLRVICLLLSPIATGSVAPPVGWSTPRSCSESAKILFDSAPESACHRPTSCQSSSSSSPLPNIMEVPLPSPQGRRCQVTSSLSCPVILNSQPPSDPVRPCCPILSQRLVCFCTGGPVDVCSWFPLSSPVNSWSYFPVTPQAWSLLFLQATCLSSLAPPLPRGSTSNLLFILLLPSYLLLCDCLISFICPLMSSCVVCHVHFHFQLIVCLLLHWLHMSLSGLFLPEFLV